MIADEHFRATSPGRDTWRLLIGPNASLQAKCNKEGFNSQGSHSLPKPGSESLVTNKTTACLSSDSRIGFGTGGHPDKTNSCGKIDEAKFNPDNGERRIETMGYILVQ